MADEPTWQQQIAELRQQRHQREAGARAREIESEYKFNDEQRYEAAQEGSLELFEDYDRECEHLEKEYVKVAPAPQQPQWTHEDLVWAAQRRDLDTPVNKLKFQQFEAVARGLGPRPKWRRWIPPLPRP
jgi:hypothetical protein